MNCFDAMAILVMPYFFDGFQPEGKLIRRVNDRRVLNFWAFRGALIRGRRLSEGGRLSE